MSLALWIPLAGLVGLFVGSFLNVVVYRVPAGLSVSRPRSFCPICERQLRWWENIPVLSWLALRAKCHTCHTPISARYPLVELTGGVTFALVTWSFHASAAVPGLCLLTATGIAVALIEYGGVRAPVSVAAAGGALAVVAFVIAGVWTRSWSLAWMPAVGYVLGLVLVAVLRSYDEACADPRGHGRSLLIVALCWLGALTWPERAWSVGIWILLFWICSVSVWLTSRTSRTLPKALSAVIRVPLVTGIVAGCLVSLLASH